VVVLTCPKCSLKTSLAPFDGTEPCPYCGQLLASRDSVAPQDIAAEDEILVAELRDAFDYGERGIARGLESLTASTGRKTGSSSPPADITPLAAGSRLDDFEILGELGRGGMGIVYRARQRSLDRIVALKVLSSTRRRNRRAVRRFRTEAQAAARLHHENIVPVYAHGEYEDHVYYSMMLVEGDSLDTVIHSKPELLSSTTLPGSSVAEPSAASDSSIGIEIPRPQAVPPRSARDSSAPSPRTAADYRHIALLLAGVADGLAHAHERGVVHRDVKPHNLLLGSDCRLRITDFGLAYLTDEPRLTLSGEVMGTPVYLSPEQVRGDLKAIDHRTDIYSLGVTLYEVITGRHPFQGAVRDEILHRICCDEPLPPRRLDPFIPKDLETICLRALEKKPADRHPAASVLADDLRRFSEGRPILSRRIGPIEKMLKWARRRKAAATAITSTFGVLVLAVGLTASLLSTRRREAALSIDRAFTALAIHNYKDADAVAADLERAAALGADPIRLGVTRALAALGARNAAGAVQEALGVLEQDPHNRQARYLMSWAHWRQGDQTASRELLAEADRLGGPQSPEDWFFRGMAAHFDRADLAIDSYRRAIDEQLRLNRSYPQAVLHLARAFNQRLYERRNLDDFSVVESSLVQLIEHNYRDAYPYYLLSIAHRLAGEIYQSHAGTQSARNAAEHYDEALQWARQGQRVDPGHQSPVLAEAECLESMGRFQEAVAARTRAFALASERQFEWECLHYRWRLHYWLGQWEEALADLQDLTAYVPEGDVFVPFYTALLYAELGDLERAVREILSLADAAPDNAQAIVWTATGLRLLGRGAEADALLTRRADQLHFDVGLVPPQSAAWVAGLCRLAAGQASLESTLRAAGDAESPGKLAAEVHFHAGVWAIGQGNRADAIEHFQKAHESFDSQLRYTYHAKTFLQVMQSDPDWPPWIHDVSGTDPDIRVGDEHNE